MLGGRSFSLFLAFALPTWAATFGTVVPHTAPFSDIVLDESRSLLYLLNPSVSPAKVEIYDISKKTPQVALGTSSITVDSEPLAMAMSPDGKYLYVACYSAATLDVIDLTTRTKVRTVTLGANPEAVAVGYDGKALISTIGGSGRSVLATYDPAATELNALQGISVSPSAPTAPTIPPPNSTMYLAAHARLVATPDGKTIVGVHEYNNTRTLFVYNPASATVLASRTVSGISPILAISADGSKFMSGPLLFDTKTLAVLGTQNINNSSIVFTSGTNLSATASYTSTTQIYGGAVFAPGGAQVFTAYNIPPYPSTTARADMGQLLVNSASNLLIQLGIQLPENLSGKMVIAAASSTIYAISQSGFIMLPMGSLQQSPLAVPDSNVALLATDQCGVVAAQNSAVIPVRNAGTGNMTLTTSLYSSTSTSTQASVASKSYGADLTVRLNSAVSRTIGTATPDQVVLQSQQAVNVIPAVRVFQNNRNSEARGSIVPVDVGATTSVTTTGGGFGGGGTTPLGLTDLLADPTRNQLYIANPGMNRIEVFNTKTQQFGTPISVGQLPRSMAFGSSDASTLYVANSGSESVTIVDLTKGSVTGTATFPPLAFSTGTTATTLVYPWAIASSQHGPRVLMTDGTLWKIVGNSLLPLSLTSAAVGTVTAIASPQQAQMVSSADGTYTLILSGTGMAYLYSAVDDTIVNARSALSNSAGQITSYYGPLAAGPSGEYYLVNDQILNQSLTIVSSPTTSTSTGTSPPVQIGPITIPGMPSTTVSLTARPVAALAAVTAANYIRFSTALRTSSNVAATDAGLVELVDLSTQRAVASANALEGPLTQVTGSTRVNVPGRTMALDSTTAIAYVLTASGLSVIPFASTSPSATPSLRPSPVGNTANYQAKVAPGGLVSFFGQNLASNATAGGVPLPTTLGGSCVTLSNSPLPLLLASPTQINAQLPPTLAAGSYALVVRSTTNQAASNSAAISVSKYAPAVFVDDQGPQIYHKDGTRVNKDHPASRDEPLTIYATGLGVTTGGKVTAGNYSPSSPLAVTAAVQVFFGDPTYSNTGLIVDWSGLLPGYIGVYQIKCRIPGNHWKGDALPVTLRIGGVSSPVTGANVPVVYVN